MAKIVTDYEMADIVRRAVEEMILDDADAYAHFLASLGELIVDHFGGERGAIGIPDADLGWTCGFRINDSVPPDGGVFAKYDPDVTWSNGKEVQA
jgi:hypothetical protein